VIRIHEQLPPKQMPKPLNFPRWKAPPYSDRAVLSDAWTRAWMLLEISATGEVTRFKWLKRPGYDLEKLATTEVFKIKFSPAIDATGKATRLFVIWKFEWPSVEWQTVVMNNTRSRMPSESEMASVPCRGGAWNFGSAYIGGRDCSKPDLAKARTEQWVGR
jgi:hypothetical protein